MTFNAELCNYTLSFVRAINRTENPLKLAQSLLTSNGYLIIQNIFIPTLWSDNDASRRFLKKRDAKACQKDQRHHVEFHAIKLTCIVL